MYSYSFDSNPAMAGMLYARIAQRSSGLATYEALGTTYAMCNETVPNTTLVTPENFSMSERILLHRMWCEVLILPTEVENLEALVRNATEAWRSLLRDAHVQRVWTDYEAVIKEVENRTASGLFLPLDDGQPATEFERFQATEEERTSIGTIENNILEMTTDRTPMGDYL